MGANLANPATLVKLPMRQLVLLFLGLVLLFLMLAFAKPAAATTEKMIRKTARGARNFATDEGQGSNTTTHPGLGGI